MRVKTLPPVDVQDPAEKSPSNRFLNQREVQEFLGISRSTLWALRSRRADRIPEHGWAGRPKFLLSEILAWMSHQRKRMRRSASQRAQG